MLKILYFLDYGKQYGGAVHTIISQGLLMKKAGHQVHFFVSDYYGNEIEPIYLQIGKENDITLESVTYQMSSQPEDFDMVCLTKYYDALKEKILKYHPDILHSVQINPMVELIGRELSIPHIMNIYPLRADFFELSYLDIFPHYHICDSLYWAEQWHEYLHTDYTCIRTVACSMHKKIYTYDEAPKAFSFMCAGAVYEEKNQMSVILAVEMLLHRGLQVKLDIYGQDEGEYAFRCRQYIQEHKLDNYIRMLGFVEDIGTRYIEYDALICGSKRESYPNVISEALANKLVVISTPVAGVPEVIVDRVNGFLTEDYSAEAISDKLLEYIKFSSLGLLNRMIANIETTYVNTHSPERVEFELNKFYEYVIADNTHSSNIGIEDIHEQFQEEIITFERNRHKFQNPSKVALKLWYLHYVKDNIHKNVADQCHFYIWGTGKASNAVDDIVTTFFPEVHIKGYVDSRKKGIHNDLPIYKPEQVIRNSKSVIIIAAVNGQYDMIDLLDKSGKIYNEDYYIFSPRRW